MEEKQKKGYRAFPSKVDNPSKAELVSEIDFLAMDKIKLEEAPSIGQGHKKTVVWYLGQERKYLVEIQFDDKSTIRAYSLCTFTPTMGMDKIDGEFAQDIEAYFIFKQLGFLSDRLKIFKDRNSVNIQDYLKYRGYIK